MLVAWCLVLASSAAALPGGELYESARDAEGRARWADAIGLYQACAEADAALAPYAQVRAAVCRTIAGDRAGGESQLKTLADSIEPGPWKAYAAFELARIRMQNDDRATAVALFGQALESSADLWWMEDAHWEAAENAITVPGQEGLGYAYFRKTTETSIWRKKRFDAALKLTAAPGLEDRMTGIQALINNGGSEEADPLLKAVAPLTDSDPRLTAMRDRAQARIDIVRGRARTGEETLWRLGRDASIGDVGIEALVDLVNHNARNDDFVEGEQAVAALAERDPNGAAVRGARRTLAYAYAREDRPDDAAVHFGLLAGDGSAPEDAADALLAAGNAYRKLGRAREATAYFDQVVEAYPKMEEGVEAAYWSGLLMKDAGVEQASVFARLRSAATNGITYYYGHRAVEMLSELGDEDAKRALRVRITPTEYVVRPVATVHDKPASALEALKDDDRMARLQFFAVRGYPEAEWEALALGNGLAASTAPDQIYLAMGEAGATAYTAMQFAAQDGYGDNGDGSQSLTRLRIRYPRAYWDLVTSLAKETGVDPYLILSVARQESTYRPGLTSSAGARGVMQVMPATAKWLAQKDDRLDDNLHEDLGDPRNSLRLGAFYLRMMLDRYDNNVISALAAYNGGPGNCDRWRREYSNRSEADFIEMIPFTETRNYVKRVLSNYMTYHSIYPPAS